MRAGLGVALVGLVACVGCGPEPTPPEVIDAIKKLGGSGTWVSVEKDTVVAVYFHRATNGDIEHLKGLTNLKELKLFNNSFTDAGLSHLKGLTELKSLWIFNTKVTDAGLVHLKRLTKLQDLNLYDTQVTDYGLEHLKGLTNLQTLKLHQTKLTDAGVKQLQQALPNCKIWHSKKD